MLPENGQDFHFWQKKWEHEKGSSRETEAMGMIDQHVVDPLFKGVGLQVHCRCIFSGAWFAGALQLHFAGAFLEPSGKYPNT